MIRKFPTGALPGALGATLFLLASGCSDDDGGAPDAQVPTDAPADPDADAHMDPVEPREGTIALTETVVLDATGSPTSRGAVASISFSNPEQAPGETRQIDGCTVTTLDADDDMVHLDEGPITVEGTGLGAMDGHLVCRYDLNRSGYVCEAAQGASVTMSLDACGDVGGPCLSDTGGILTIHDDVADDHALVGARIRLEGLDDVPPQQAFMIRNQQMQDDTSVLTLAHAGAFGDVATDAEAGAYDITVGEGPDPALVDQGTTFLPSDADGETRVILTKGGTDHTPPLDVSVYPLGEDMTLASGEIEVDGQEIPHLQPFELFDDTFFANGYHEVPEVRFSCDSDLGGRCLPDGHDVDPEDLPGNPVLIVSGRAMDAPEETFVTFTCISTDPRGRTVALSDAVLQAIADANPSRVETTVTHASAFIVTSDDPPGTIRIMVGHSLTGHADVPDEAFQ